MQPTETRDVGAALDDRPVPDVWPRPTHVGKEKYLAGFSIIEAFDLDVALKLATEGSKTAIGRSRRGAAKAGRPRLRPAQVSSDGFDESDRSQPAHQKVLKEIRETVSDQVRGVRSRGESRPRGAPRTTGDDPRCSTWFP
jgi:hypothetical protein